MKKLTILIDMDDVIADTSEKLIAIFNSLNHTDFQKENFYTQGFYETVHQPVYISYRPSLFEPGFFRDINVIPGAQEAVKWIFDQHNAYIVSAAVEFPHSLHEKYLWLQEHFPFIPWQRIILCGSKAPIKGDLIIDDHEKNLINFEGDPLLFSAPHNYMVKGYNRVDNWSEALAYVKKLSQSTCLSN